MDPEGIIEVRELLLDLATNSGVTILVSSHKLDEIARVATNITIIHKGTLIKEVDGPGLERELNKTLLVSGKDPSGMRTVLSNAGYKVTTNGKHEAEHAPVLCIDDAEAIDNPEQIATMLVNEGTPPNLLKVEKEDLETYFTRTIHEAEELIK